MTRQPSAAQALLDAMPGREIAKLFESRRHADGVGYRPNWPWDENGKPIDFEARRAAWEAKSTAAQEPRKIDCVEDLIEALSPLDPNKPISLEMVDGRLVVHGLTLEELS